MNADAWSKSDDYLCRECALKGGLTNLIFPLFTNIRENLSPFWTQTDEKFLAMCVDTAEILETTRYIWVKARVLYKKVSRCVYRTESIRQLECCDTFLSLQRSEELIRQTYRRANQTQKIEGIKENSMINYSKEILENNERVQVLFNKLKKR